MKDFEIIFMILLLCNSAEVFSQPWIPDQSNGTYKNPIIYTDYSDPDVIHVGDDFYMTASSFNCLPALPILHSKDLVNWQIVNHAIDIFPDKDFDTPQHGKGVWAPSLRYHQGEFWIFYGDPDRGIFMVKTRDIRGKWDPPVLIKQARGWIDPCPLWDDDGNAYLVHAFAKSRVGINSILHVNKMSPDGTNILDEGKLIFDGHEHHPTIEGPKFYKRNGYYYIFAPAGGVKTGWQTVLRSRNIYGPYEDKIVLAQGNTAINGPHQGGYVELANGDGWFIHFQDGDAYGRILHLQPVVWKNDWPMMGNDKDGDGIGEPVLVFKKPNVGKTFPIKVPQTSDEFDSEKLGLQWQWQANYQTSWFSLAAKKGALRLYSQVLPDSAANLWWAPNLLLQKFPAPEFIVTTKTTFHPKILNEKSGLIIMGLDYAYLALKKSHGGLSLIQASCSNAEDGSEEFIVEQVIINLRTLYLRAKVENKALCHFLYSFDGKTFHQLDKTLQAKPGKWIGAKIGLFAIRPDSPQPGGFANFDFF
jgi:beta-xylosidase